jgi:ankyrin repeat protein
MADDMTRPDPMPRTRMSVDALQEIASNAEASGAERVAQLRTLVAAGVDLDGIDRVCTAISSAAMQGDAGAVEALLAAGANPRIEPTAMAFACFAFRTDRDPSMERVIELLIVAGIDPNERDEAGYGPLHTALLTDWYGTGYCSSDGINVAAVAALLAGGATVDIVFPNLDGYGPVHAAALERSPTAIALLVAAGADPFARAPNGETPLDVARAELAAAERDLTDPPPIPPDLQRAFPRLEHTPWHQSRRDAAEATVRALEALRA